MASAVIWIIDTSSIAEIRRSVETARRVRVFMSLHERVENGTLVYPKQVLGELERAADPAAPDAQYNWAKQNFPTLRASQPSLDEVKKVLAVVPRVLDPDKDAGAEEADPYVLAMARQLQQSGREVRVITEEKNDLPKKMSLRTAAGLLGIPSVPLRAFLDFEGIRYQT